MVATGFDIHSIVAEAARASGHENELATKLVSDLDQTEIVVLAEQRVAELIWAERRAQALQNERAAAVEVLNNSEVVPVDDQKEMFAGWEADPASLVGEYQFYNDRTAFRKFMGGPKSERYAAWYARVEEIGDADKIRDFYPLGPAQYDREQFMVEVSMAVAKLAQHIRLELTAEFLGEEIALGDGTRVRWGEASIEQLEDRRQLLLRNASANAEGAARVEAAIRMIRDAGVGCLNELAHSAKTKLT